MYKHVLSIYLEQNDSVESKQLLKILVATFQYFSNFRATFGCIDKQLFLNLLAQSIHAQFRDSKRCEKQRSDLIG